MLASTLVSQTASKSIHDRFDASKSSWDALKTDFGAPKSRPDAFNSVPRGFQKTSWRILSRLLDRLSHQQEGFITIQVRSDLFLSWTDPSSTWLIWSDIALNSSYFIVKKSQGWTTHILPKTKKASFSTFYFKYKNPWCHLRTLARTHVRANRFWVSSWAQHDYPRKGQAGTSTFACDTVFPQHSPAQNKLAKHGSWRFLVNWPVLQQHQVPYLAKAIILRRWSHSLWVSTSSAPNKNCRVTTSKL